MSDDQQVDELAKLLWSKWANMEPDSWITQTQRSRDCWRVVARTVIARNTEQIAILTRERDEAQLTTAHLSESIRDAWHLTKGWSWPPRPDGNQHETIAERMQAVMDRLQEVLKFQREDMRGQEVEQLTRERDSWCHRAEHLRRCCVTLVAEKQAEQQKATMLQRELQRLRQPPLPKENPMEPVDREQFAELLYYLWYRLATTPWEKAPDKEKKQVYRVANSILAEFAVYARTPDEQLEQAEAERRSDGTAPLPPEPQHGWRFNPEWTLRRHAHRHDGPTKRERVALAVLPMLTDRFPRKSTVAEAVADCFAVADAFLAAAQQPPAEPTPPPATP